MTSFDIRHPRTIQLLDIIDKADQFTKTVLGSGLPIVHDTKITDPVISSVAAEQDHPVVLEWSYSPYSISMDLCFNSERDTSLIGGIVYLAWDETRTWHLYWETSDEGCEIGSEAKAFVTELGIPEAGDKKQIPESEVEGYARKFIAMYKRMMNSYVEKPVR